MKNWKSLTMGFVAGMTFMVTTTVIASSIDVTALLMPDVLFNIDEKLVASPSDQPVLNYKGYTYVPLRFISDYIGGEISWDPVTRRVNMRMPEPQIIEKIVEKPVEKIVYVNEDDDPSAKKSYSTLPIKKTGEHYTITITGINRDRGGNRTDLYLKMENDRGGLLQLVQEDTVLIVDGKEYPLTNRYSLWDDTSWSNHSLENDEEEEGFLVFDLIPVDSKEFTLKVATRRSDGNEVKKETMEFNFRKTFTDSSSDD